MNFHLTISLRTITTNSLHGASQKSATNLSDDVFWLFRITFMCYATIGFLVSTVVGQVVSLLTGGASQQIDENLLIPFFQSAEFKQRMRRKPETRYVTIDQMLVEMTKRAKNEHQDDVDVGKSPAN